MKRWGIGKEIFLITFFFSILAGIITFRFPEYFLINIIPRPVFIITGSVLLISGAGYYTYVLKIFNNAFKNHELVTHGPFSRMQHPLYAVWIFLIFPGISLFFRSWLFFLIPVIAFLTYKLYIKRENDALIKKFGQKYITYKASVPEIFPFRKLK